MGFTGNNEWIAQFHLFGRTIDGTKGDDVLAAEAEWNRILGLNGEDALRSAFKNTWLDGGKHNDELTTKFSIYSTGTDPVDVVVIQEGGHGDDRLSAEVRAVDVDVDISLTTWLDGGRHDDIISASSSTNRTNSGISDGIDVREENNICGGSGNDSINSVAFIFAVSGNIIAINRIDGGNGNDVIDATAQTEGAPYSSLLSNEIYGGRGHDRIKAVADGDFWGGDSTATNVLVGGTGNDTLDATAIVESNGSELASNTLDGGAGDDYLRAFVRTDSNTSSPVGKNVLFGGRGNDILEAIQSTDGENFTTDVENALYGGAGSDSLTADMTALAFSNAKGKNLLEGGPGGDILTAHLIASAPEAAAVFNILNGGKGNDVLTATLKATVSEWGAVEAENILNGGKGDDILMATVAPDTDGQNSLSGGTGNDELFAIGGSGNTLDGGKGRDTLTGSEGNDIFIGGSGTDTFVLNPSSGCDEIADFQDGQDHLDIRGYGFTGVNDLTMSVDGANAIVAFDDQNKVEIVGAAGLIDAADFWFV